MSSGVGCRGAECDFANFLRGRFWGLGTNGDGAPPPERMHLKFQIYPSGSPQTKFGVECNGFVTATPRLAIIWITYWEHDPTVFERLCIVCSIVILMVDGKYYHYARLR